MKDILYHILHVVAATPMVEAMQGRAHFMGRVLQPRERMNRLIGVQTNPSF
jgi:hypothetical protein